MEVEVKLYASLRRYRPQTVGGAPHHPFQLTLPPGATLSTLVARLEIPDGLINAAAVNGEAAVADTFLNDGDTVSLFPPAAGGS